MLEENITYDFETTLQKLVTLGKYKDAFELGQRYNKKVQVVSRDGRSSYILHKDGSWRKENKNVGT
jgi:outer membrane receptor for Fe3+-dicitrate